MKLRCCSEVAPPVIRSSVNDQAKTENSDSDKKDKVASKNSDEKKIKSEKKPIITPKNKANMNLSPRAAGLSAGEAKHLHKNPPSSA